MPSIQVTVTTVDQPTALLHHYPDRDQPQDTYLQLDLATATLSCDYNAETGDAIPSTVAHGLVRRYTIPTLTADAANTLMGAATSLAHRVCAGATITWDGHNHVAHLNTDAADAEELLLALCADDNFSNHDLVTEWAATDWFGGQPTDDIITSLNLTADTTDEQLTALAAQQEEEARRSTPGGHLVLTGAREYLTGLRDTLTRVRGELAHYDVITKSPLLGYDADDTGIALQHQGEWEADVATPTAAARLLATGLDAPTTIITPTTAICPSGNPRWMFTTT